LVCGGGGGGGAANCVIHTHFFAVQLVTNMGES